MADRKQQRLTEMLAAREFSEAAVIEFCAELTVDELIRQFGEPKRHTEYAKADGWKVGDGRPEHDEQSLAFDDPAVMQAIARCASARTRWKDLPKVIPLGAIHPTVCGWCKYPLGKLLSACAWSVHQSGYVLADVLIWEGKDRSVYSRPAGLTGYQRPAYRLFWALPANERERRIEAASGRPLVEGVRV